MSSYDDGRNFVDEEDRIIIPLVQFANGRNETDRGDPFTGFYMECGQYAALDDCFTDVRQPTVRIRHMRGVGEKPEIKQHWDFGKEISFYPITRGPCAMSIYGLLDKERGRDGKTNYQRTLESGLAAYWGESKSGFAFAGYFSPTVELKKFHLVQFSVKSLATDELIQALVRHMNVVGKADSIIDRKRHPEGVRSCELAFPLAVGEDRISRTSKRTSGSTSVFPIVCQHPKIDEVDKDYIVSKWALKGIVDAAKKDWDTVLSWSSSLTMNSKNKEVR